MTTTATFTETYTIMQRISDAYASWLGMREQRRAVRELRSVGNRTLKDIGMDRSEAMSVVYGASAGRRHRFTAETNS